MCKKVMYVSCIALLLGQVVIADPILIWQFNEGVGDAVLDKSGNGHDGVINGAEWEAGGYNEKGFALSFEGGTTVEDADAGDYLNGLEATTVAIWIKSNEIDSDRGFLTGVPPAEQDRVFTIRYDKGGWNFGGTNVIKMGIQATDGAQDIESSSNVQTTEWQHVAMTWESGGEIRLYINGKEDDVAGRANPNNTGTISECTTLIIGKGGKDTNNGWNGLIDEVRIFDAALTAEEIQIVMLGGGDELASSPSPNGDSVDVPRDAVLTWCAGDFAVTHDVYLGTVFDDVNDGAVGTLASQGQDVNSLDVGIFDYDQTYYWRVDEVNGAPDNTVFKGSVWSFTVEPYSIPVESVTATASSSFGEFSLPEKTLDGSGLDANDMHDITTENMWFTAMNDAAPWIQYEFDGVKKLDIMTVWNSNGSAEGPIGYGIKEVLIETSLDGETWDVFEDVNEFSRAPGLPTYNQPDEIDFGGVAAKMVRLNIQSNWGGILVSYSLSEVQFSAIPTAARTPEPESGSVDVLPDAVVSWRAGREATQSTVYVSTDPNEVADGIAASAMSNTNSINLSAFDIELGQTYYWRVDEVNEAEVPSVWTGPVWSLSTPEALIVDDFEGYNNNSPDRPFQTWLDGIGYSADEFFPAGYGGNGTGVAIGHDIWSVASAHYNGDIMETANTIAGSDQSMPFYYSNSGNVASETQRTFAVPQDWTVGGAETLSIPFVGTAGNTGTLYVKINGVKVTYPRDPGNLALGGWLAFNIDLTSMDVQSVTELAIGAEGAGASGMLLIDDITLHRAAGVVVTPVDPGSDNIVAQYAFEGNANDSSGDGLNGAIVDGQVVSSGRPKGGTAVQFDLGYVDLGNPAALDFSTVDWSVTAWFKTRMTGATNRGAIFAKGGDNGGGHRYALVMSEGNEGRVTLVCDDNAKKVLVNSSSVTNDDQWHFVVGQREGTSLQIYIDGELQATASVAETYDLSGTAQHNGYIGAITDNSNASLFKFFSGLIDDVAVYDRALSTEEILWLAGWTEPIDKPF